MIDPDLDKVILLPHFDGTPGGNAFTDASPGHHPLTAVGNAVTSSTAVKFGATSLYPGTGRVDIADSTDFLFGTGDFTIEGWVYPTGIGVPFLSIQTSTHLFLPLYMTSATLGRVTMYNVIRISNIPFAASQWSHYALTRAGNTLTAWVNGQQARPPVSISGLSVGGSTKLAIGGSNGYPTHSFQGYADELRITKGLARYTAPFTPPTEPFSTQRIVLSLSGIGKFTDGAIATAGRIWSRSTGALLADFTPAATDGQYSVTVATSAPVDLTIFRDGYRPLTHGPVTPHETIVD